MRCDAWKTLHRPLATSQFWLGLVSLHLLGAKGRCRPTCLTACSALISSPGGGWCLVSAVRLLVVRARIGSLRRGARTRHDATRSSAGWLWRASRGARESKMSRRNGRVATRAARSFIANAMQTRRCRRCPCRIRTLENALSGYQRRRVSGKGAAIFPSAQVLFDASDGLLAGDCGWQCDRVASNIHFQDRRGTFGVPIKTWEIPARFLREAHQQRLRCGGRLELRTLREPANLLHAFVDTCP